MHLLICTLGILGFVSLSRIPSRGVIRAHPREGLSPCLCCPPLLYVWLFFAMHVLNFHTVYIFFCFYCIGCVFSLCFVITILQLCLLGQCSMFFTFCIASSITAFYSLPSLISCWLAYSVPTLFILLLACRSHSLSTMICSLA